MPYSQYSLDQVAIQIGVLLDDTSELYWVRNEKYLAIWEALRHFGALTNYWRTRGTFSVTPASLASNQWIDLSVQLSALRTRAWTLAQFTTDIQYALLEAPNGISGTGMSGQVSITNILNAIQRARNRFVFDVRFPLSVHSQAVPAGPSGEVQFPQASTFVHRASWQDSTDGSWSNLWREDAWSVDHGNPSWTSETGPPASYSEAENAPLLLQISPIPSNSGTLEVLTVDSLIMDLTNPASTFNIPDEWIYAVKYAALSDIFSSENQISDPGRAQYCESRYQQMVNFAKDARSVLRLLASGATLPIDAFAAIDAGQPYWRNQSGPPSTAGVLYDWVGFFPAIPDQGYIISADVSQSAPIPLTGSSPIPLGVEEVDNIIVNYASHILTLKCGGNEFQSTFPLYNAAMAAIAGRKGVNAAKIRYLQPLFGQPQREWASRPDRMGATS